MLQGQLYIIKGNEPILLDDQKTVWVIQSGSMALFAVTVKNDVYEGTRRYLSTIGQGKALFGTTPNQTRDLASGHDDRQRLILAVPMGETELLKLDRECFDELVANADAKAIAWVEDWLGQLGSILPHDATPAIQVRAEPSTRFSLTNAQTFQPQHGVVCWVDLTQGTIRFLGFEELTLTSARGTFPLGDQMWIEAVEGVQLTTFATSEICNPDTLLLGLSLLHTQLLHYIDVLDQREAEEELQRLGDRCHFSLWYTPCSQGTSTAGIAGKYFWTDGAVNQWDF